MIRPFGFCALFLIALASCTRPSVNLGEPREVEAGVPVFFGDATGPELTWEFGDGTAPVKGTRVGHPFHRTGQFTVVAKHGNDVVSSVQLTVTPRPVLRAVPQAANVVLYVPTVEGNLEPALDFFERLAGADSVQRFLDAVPLVNLAFTLSAPGAPEASWLDRQEGLALYWSKDASRLQAALGITEPSVAIQQLIEALPRTIASDTAPDGSMRLLFEDGSQLAVWEDRGYVYLAYSNDAAGAFDLLDAAVVEVRTSPVEGFAARAGTEFEKISLQPTHVRLAVAAEEALGGKMWMGMKFEPTRMQMEGVLQSNDPKPLWSVDAAKPPATLERLPEGPLAMLSVSAAPDIMRKFVSNLLGEEGGQPARPQLRALGLQRSEIEAAQGSFDGTAVALFYLDPASALAGLTQGAEAQYQGSVMVEAGLVDSGPLARLLETRAASLGLERVGKGGGPSRVARYAGHLRQQAAALEVGEKRLTLELGEPLGARKWQDLQTQLAGRFGGGAFGAGHVTLLVDFGQMQRDLTAAVDPKTGKPVKNIMERALLAGLLKRATPLDHALLDIAPSPEGARLQGRIELNPP